MSQCRKLEHRKGCTGSCMYCNYLRREARKSEELKRQKITIIAWDEPSVML